jgi:hypothetical protein
MKNMSWLIRFLFMFPSLFMTKESKTGIRVCTAPELRGTSGMYFDGTKAIDLNFEKAYKDRLWADTRGYSRA